MAIGARIVRGLPRSRAGALERPEPAAISGRVALHYPQGQDYRSWSALRGLSRRFLEPWEPSWPEDELTRIAYRRRLQLYARAIRAGEAYPFFVMRRGDQRLMGGLTLSNIRRGVTQSCTLGYWIGTPFARHGYMTDAVWGAVTFAFERLGLHRIEAACLPSNEASRRLLLKCGFSEEGYARHYLKINGTWQDHVLFGMLDTDPRP